MVCTLQSAVQATNSTHLPLLAAQPCHPHCQAAVQHRWHHASCYRRRCESGSHTHQLSPVPSRSACRPNLRRLCAHRTPSLRCLLRMQIAAGNPLALLRPSLWKQRTALHCAARAGATEALCAVLDVASRQPSFRSFLDMPDGAGDTALALACKHG